jgi:hypothetical protein
VRHLAGTLVALAVLVAAYAFVFWAVTGGVAHGAEDHRARVTHSEWARVQTGMTKHEVRAILDGPGHYSAPGVYWYPTQDKSPRHRRAVVVFRHGVLSTGVWVVVSGGEFQ